MCNLPYNKHGFTLIEVVIAIFLTSVAILSILSLQPSAWRTAGKSDYLGRASGILFEELQRQEALIMNPCVNVATGTTGPTPVFAAGGAAAQPAGSGDFQFNVTTTITSIGTNVWRVTVLVAWPGHTGITESLTVTRQEYFRTPGGCP